MTEAEFLKWVDEEFDTDIEVEAAMKRQMLSPYYGRSRG